MNKNKKGFTMSELLLCFAIVGVVSAMGMTLSKYNVERAYNAYWSAGYSNLLSAIVEDSQNGNNQILKTCDEIFRDTNTSDPAYNIPQEVTARNGIRYYNYNPVALNQYFIDMEVPQAKTRRHSSGNAWTRFLYTPEVLLLFPVPLDYIPVNENRDTYVDLSDSNLLKFTVKDGRKGNRLMNGDPADPDERLEVQTFRSAYCRSDNLRGTNRLTGRPQTQIPNLSWDLFVDPDNGCNGIIHDLEGTLDPVL